MNEDTMDETTTTGSLLSKGFNRRGFLGVAGALGAAAVLAACGSDGSDSSSTTAASGGDETTTTAGSDGETTTTAAEDGGAAADLKVGAVAAGLEVLAVNTYKAALDAAGAGKLGEVPPAVGEFATTAMAHHQEALDAWNKILTDNGAEAVSDPPADLEKTVNEAFGKVTDVGGVAKLALQLEQTAAATYLKVLPELTVEGAIKLAASIQPIDMQHAAVLLFVLGEYPVPDTFASTEMAAA